MRKLRSWQGTRGAAPLTRKALLGAVAFCAVHLVAGSARAQLEGFGESGSMGFGADRLFAIHKSSFSLELPNGNDVEYDATGIGFGWRGPLQPTPYDVPRLGFDYFVIDNLSVGGALAYASLNVDDDDNEDSELSAFLFSPRVGYFIGIGSVVGFWIRGGFTYHSYDGQDIGIDDEHGLALGGEGMFVIGPTPHFAFMAGPYFDLGFSGERDCGNQDCDIRYRSFGLAFGLLGWL